MEKGYSLTGRYIPLGVGDETSTPEDVEQNGGIVGDTVTDLEQGVIGLGRMATGLGDLVLSNVGVKDAPLTRFANDKLLNEWEAHNKQEYSKARQEAEAQYAKDTDFGEDATWVDKGVGYAKALAMNPRVAFGRVAENAPTLVLSGGVSGLAGRAAMGQAVKAGTVQALSREAITEAAKLAGLRGARNAQVATDLLLGAGDTASTIIDHNVKDGREATQGINYAIPAGIVDAATGRVMSRFGGDIETRMFLPNAGEGMRETFGSGVKGFAKGVGASTLNEGVEEGIQSPNETIMANLGTGRPWDEGAVESAFEGGFIGGFTGGLAHAGTRAFSRSRKQDLLQGSHPQGMPTGDTAPNTSQLVTQEELDAQEAEVMQRQKEFEAKKLADKEAKRQAKAQAREQAQAQAQAQAPVAEDEFLAKGADVQPQVEHTYAPHFQWTRADKQAYDEMPDYEREAFDGFAQQVSVASSPRVNRYSSPRMGDYHAYNQARNTANDPALFDKVFNSLLVGQREAGLGTFSIGELVNDAREISNRATVGATSEEQVYENVLNEMLARERSMEEQYRGKKSPRYPMVSDVYNAAADTFENGDEWTTERHMQWMDARNQYRITEAQNRRARKSNAPVQPTVPQAVEAVSEEVAPVNPVVTNEEVPTPKPTTPKKWEDAPENSSTALVNVHKAMQEVVAKKGDLLTQQEATDVVHSLGAPAVAVTGEFNPRTWGEKKLNQYIAKGERGSKPNGRRAEVAKRSQTLKDRKVEFSQRLREKYPNRRFYVDELRELYDEAYPGDKVPRLDLFVEDDLRMDKLPEGEAPKNNISPIGRRIRKESKKQWTDLGYRRKERARIDAENQATEKKHTVVKPNEEKENGHSEEVVKDVETQNPESGHVESQQTPEELQTPSRDHEEKVEAKPVEEKPEPKKEDKSKEVVEEKAEEAKPELTPTPVEEEEDPLIVLKDTDALDRIRKIKKGNKTPNSYGEELLADFNDALPVSYRTIKLRTGISKTISTAEANVDGDVKGFIGYYVMKATQIGDSDVAMKTVASMLETAKVYLTEDELTSLREEASTTVSKPKEEASEEEEELYIGDKNTSPEMKEFLADVFDQEEHNADINADAVKELTKRGDLPDDESNTGGVNKAVNGEEGERDFHAQANKILMGITLRLKTEFGLSVGKSALNLTREERITSDGMYADSVGRIQAFLNSLNDELRKKVVSVAEEEVRKYLATLKTEIEAIGEKALDATTKEAKEKVLDDLIKVVEKAEKAKYVATAFDGELKGIANDVHTAVASVATSIAVAPTTPSEVEKETPKKARKDAETSSETTDEVTYEAQAPQWKDDDGNVKTSDDYYNKQNQKVAPSKEEATSMGWKSTNAEAVLTAKLPRGLARAVSYVKLGAKRLEGVAVDLGQLGKHATTAVLRQVLDAKTSRALAGAVNTITSAGWNIDHIIVVDPLRSEKPTKVLGKQGEASGIALTTKAKVQMSVRGEDGQINTKDVGSDKRVVAFKANVEEGLSALRGKERLSTAQQMAQRSANIVKEKVVPLHEMFHAVDSSINRAGAKAMRANHEHVRNLRLFGNRVQALITRGKVSTPQEAKMVAYFGWGGLGALCDELANLNIENDNKTNGEEFAIVASNFLANPAFQKLLTFKETAQDAKALENAINIVKDEQNAQLHRRVSDSGKAVQKPEDGHREVSSDSGNVQTVHNNADNGKVRDGGSTPSKLEGHGDSGSGQSTSGRVDNSVQRENPTYGMEEGEERDRGQKGDTTEKNSTGGHDNGGMEGVRGEERSTLDSSDPGERSEGASLLPYSPESDSNSTATSEGRADDAQNTEHSETSSVGHGGDGNPTPSTSSGGSEGRGNDSSRGNGNGGVPPNGVQEGVSQGLSSVTPGITSSIYRALRNTIDKRISNPSVRAVANSFTELVAKTAFGFYFTKDLVNYASRLLPSARRWYNAMERSAAYRRHFQQTSANISREASKLPRDVYRKMNEAIAEITLDGLWVYREPRVHKTEAEYMKYVSELKPKQKEAYERNKALYDALPSDAKRIVREVFLAGLLDRQTRINTVLRQQQRWYEAIKAQTKSEERLAQIEEEFMFRQKAVFNEWGRDQRPYAPIRRFGTHVTVARSQALQALMEKSKQIQERLDATDDEAKRSALRTMLKENADAILEAEQDPNQFLVIFSESLGEANEVARSLRSQHPEFDVQAYAKADFIGERVPSYKKLQQIIDSTSRAMGFDELVRSGTADLDRRAFAQMRALAEDMYIHMLSEESGRKSELERRKIRGFHGDMIENLTENAVSQSTILAGMEYGSEILDALTSMRKEIKNHRGVNQELAGLLHNELLRHYDISLNPANSKLVSNLMQLSSFQLLMLRPAYYVQNLTQPMMMSAPYMAKDFGVKAYKAMMGNMKEVTKLVSRGDVTLEDLEQAFKGDPDLIKALREERDLGRIDVGLSLDMGRVEGRSQLAHVARKVGDRMQGWSRNVETINRVATFVTAYKLAKENGFADPHAYASDVVYRTHGDYSGLNSPSNFNRNAFLKMVTQFRKFQLIQIGMVTPLLVQAFKGATHEERVLGRKAVLHTMAVHFAMTGIKGLPVIGAMMAVLPMAFGDPGDDDEDVVRKALKDKQLSDFLLHGFPKLFGVDMTQKIGAGEMFSVLPFYEFNTKGGKDNFNELLASSLGPSASIGARAFQGLKYASNGDFMKGFEQLLPNGLSDALKAYRMSTEGMSTTHNVTTLKPEDYKAYDAFMRAMGFPTNKETDKNRLQDSLFRHNQAIEGKYDEIRRDYVRAYKAKDEKAMAKARKEWLEVSKQSKALGLKPRTLSSLLRSGRMNEKASNLALEEGTGVAVQKREREFIRQMKNL